jgi:transposase
MRELVKSIDPDLRYVKHRTHDGMMQIHARSARKKASCPYCGHKSDRVHSIYPRKFRDLPIQDKKVEIIINNRKFFCLNTDCAHKTFAETFSCLPKMGRRSERLTKTILNTATNLSSVTASKTLKHGTADIGKSTICRLLKKELQNREE